jgi:hypothetical protein
VTGGAAGGELHGLPSGRGAGDLEALYAADRWRADDLGVAAARDRQVVSFAQISQLWLRQAAKRWARQRLARNCAFNTVAAGTLAFKRLSASLDHCQPPVTGPTAIDRALIERYLAWLAPLPLAEGTKTLSRVFLRAFLDENRRHRWVETIGADASTTTSCLADTTACPASSPRRSWRNWNQRTTWPGSP